MAHASSYEDPGTPEEQSRRTFLANATLTVGGVIGLVLAVPIVTYLVPSKAVLESSGRNFWPLKEDEMKKLQAAVAGADPVKVFFTHKVQDGYLAAEDLEDYVWGVKMSDAELAKMKQDRTDLSGGGKVDYEWAALGLVLFSSICPHLGCKFNWVPEKKTFLCPCHNSEFKRDGEHIAGPAARGLDPLPLREKSGKAEVTWIRYKPQIGDRVIISYT